MREAVALSLMPAAFRLRPLLLDSGSVDTLTILGTAFPAVAFATDVSSTAVESACFFFFLVLAVVLFKECVRPCSSNRDMRADKRSRSAVAIGKMVMMFSASYDSLHYDSLAMRLDGWDGL